MYYDQKVSYLFFKAFFRILRKNDKNNVIKNNYQVLFISQSSRRLNNQCF